VRSNEPPIRTPQVIRADRRDGALRAFLKPTLWTLAASLALVAVTGIVTVRALRSREAPAAPDPGSFAALRDTPLDAPAPGIIATTPTSKPHAFPPAAELSDAGRAALAAVDAAERERAGGGLSVARKRFDPCPGADVERVAWIDTWSRIVKLTATRAGARPVTVEHWFDQDGRLRGARATRAGEGGFSVSALFDERGVAVEQGATGASPPLDELRLVAKDPSSAFFEAPRCDPVKGGAAQ
jgi:hypothetical protein